PLHGIVGTLSHGSPGTTVDVLLPSTMFGPIDVLAPGFAPAAATIGPRLADEPTLAAPSEQYAPDLTWAESAIADDDLDPTLPPTPIMPAVAASADFDEVV